MVKISIREILEEQERRNLSPYATLSVNNRGRERKERPCDIRPDFQHDRDRIIHSKSFRRLKHKTQVFLAPEGDHYRTRLTHTLEVSQIARTVSKALRLNEDLTEAIALGHDLGHTPFGHAGEKVLSEIYPKGFKHWEQSVRVVEKLEMGGKGLNLTFEVRDGILKHSKGKSGSIVVERPDGGAVTLEGQAVRLADIMAYLNHDLDDAIRAGIISTHDIPSSINKYLGDSYSERINTMVCGIVNFSLREGGGLIGFDDELLGIMNDLRSFLFRKVYESGIIRDNFKKASRILKELYDYFLNNIDILSQSVDWPIDEKDSHRTVCDFIAGMSDQYALSAYSRLLLPKAWEVY